MKPQINLRLPGQLKKAAEKYVRAHNYRNLQELATEAIREKVMEKNYDESFTPKEIELIDRLIDATIKKGALISEKEFRKALK
jgi:Arc/MetJ-type ribon-helix-helix transcriptional regulator